MSESKPPPLPDNVRDMFSELFGAAFGTTTTKSGGQDLRHDLALTYAQARDGATCDVEYTRQVRCVTCDGTGDRGSSKVACSACAGKGRIEQTQGFFQIQSSCAACRGRGTQIENPCAECENGLRATRGVINVKVPPGVENGQVLRIPGKGDDGVIGDPGHLYLMLAVDTLGVLVRKGDDVELELELDLRHSLVGGALQVDTLDGPLTVHVPRTARDGTVIVIPDRGHVRQAAPEGGDPYRGAAPRGVQRVVVRISPEVAARTRFVMMIVAFVISAVAMALLLR